MSPRPPSISAEAWRKHEQTIKSLYHDQELPLESEPGRPSLIQVMRDEYNFTATPSQYERQLRKWSSDTSKNLKHDEWRLLFAQVDRLTSQGKTCRVKLSGRVIDEKRLKRARRRYAKPFGAETITSLQTSMSLAKYKHISIEIERQRDEWFDITSCDYNTLDTDINFSSVSPGGCLATRSTSAAESLNTVFNAGLSNHVDVQATSTTLDASQLPLASSPSSTNLPFSAIYTGPCYRVVDSRHYENGTTLEPTYIYDILVLPSPFYQLHLIGLQKSDQTPLNGQLKHVLSQARASSNPSSVALAFQTPQQLLESLLQDTWISYQQTSTLPRGTRPLLPSAPDVLDRLESLLPPDNFQGAGVPNATSIISPEDHFEGRFSDILLYSVLNGFAGFRGVPVGSLFKLLRSNSQISYPLFMKLSELEASSSEGNTLASFTARSLAENLFRAAVEACDAEAIRVIFRAVEGGPNKIHPDDIVCEFEDRLYTPLEFVAKKQHIPCIQVLITLGADANKTYEEDDYMEQGPLEIALQKCAAVFQPLDFTIVDSLLQAGAKVREGLLRSAIRRSQDFKTHKALIEKIQPKEHRSFFGRLYESVAFLTNQLAMSLVIKLSKFCLETRCFKCVPSRDILTHAALRSNTKLCEFLSIYMKPNSSTLAAAIRGGDRDLVNLLVEKGASVQDDKGRLRTLDASVKRELYENFEFITPLSEAIRCRNKWFMDFVGRLGSWECLEKSGHLIAAIEACVDADCNQLLKKLLLLRSEMGLSRDQKDLSPALCAAIRQDNIPIASTLLAAGAGVNAFHGYRERPIPLIDAIRFKNRALVDLILESDVNVKDIWSEARGGERTSVMEAAGQWGEASIIIDLIDVGFNADDGFRTTALAEAVKTGRTDLVDLLLKYGADPSAAAVEGKSPLHEAADKGDVKMIRYLLLAGANPANSGALLSAGGQEGEVLSVLLTALTSKYPNGCKNFGSDVLIQTIQKDDAVLLDTFLAAKMSPHGFSSKHNCTPLGAAIRHKGSNSMAAVRRLLRAGVNVESVAGAPYGLGGGVGNTVWPRQTALLETIETRDEDKVKLILENDAIINRAARRGLKRTPLQKACEIGSYKIVKLLLDRGAVADDVAALRGGGTALQLASGTGSISIVQLLLANGANIHAPTSDVNGRSALENAAENGCLDIVKTLWDATNWVGFDVDEVKRATAFARKKGHRGCAQYIEELQAASKRRLAEASLSIGLV